MEDLGNTRVVGVAESSAQAVDLLMELKETWQLAVVDLFLRQGSGLTVLRACRSRAAHQHVVVLTNYATPTVVNTCLQLGAERVFDRSTELEAFFEYCLRLSDAN
jgi:DNA-binding NarL/FixJ family response regulator